MLGGAITSLIFPKFILSALCGIFSSFQRQVGGPCLFLFNKRHNTGAFGWAKGITGKTQIGSYLWVNLAILSTVKLFELNRLLRKRDDEDEFAIPLYQIVI